MSTILRFFIALANACILAFFYMVVFANPSMSAQAAERYELLQYAFVPVLLLGAMAGFARTFFPESRFARYWIILFFLPYPLIGIFMLYA